MLKKKIKNQAKTMKKNYRNKQKPGLTLIEVLLAVIIFAILSLSLYSMLNTSLSIRRKIEGQHSQFQSIYLNIENIAQDLRNIVKFKKDNSGFKPQANSLEFYTIAFNYSNKLSELVRLAYIWEDNKVYKVTKDIFTENILSKFPILDDIYSFDLYYFDPQEKNWVRELKDNKIIPIGIRIELVYKNKQKQTYNFKKYVFICTTQKTK